MKEEMGLRERKLNDTKPDSERLCLGVTIARFYGYEFGSQEATCAEFILYKMRAKPFIYFGFKLPAKIYIPLDLLLKNKNTFATMVSSLGDFPSFPYNIMSTIKTLNQPFYE